MHLLTRCSQRCLGERSAGEGGGPGRAPAVARQAAPILGTGGCFQVPWVRAAFAFSPLLMLLGQ